jgi:ABC-2 type transport system ATP-binding protein
VTEVLQINTLSKSYGKIVAVDSMSLSIKKGEIYGILGPNGSGKTTTLGMLLDVIIPDSGSFLWFGMLPVKESRRKIGAILEVPLFYPYLSGRKNLEIVARLKKLPYDQIDQVLEIVKLTGRQHSKFKTYSLGMKQRLAIAAALLGDPEVLILDEPTNGLDPTGIAEIRELIIEIGKKGITIILASHILDEVQKICSHVAVLDKGKVLFSGEVSNVLNDSSLVEIASDNMPALKIAVDNCSFVESTKQEGGVLLVRLGEGKGPGDLNHWMSDKNIVLNHLYIRKRTLEHYYLELMKNS